MLFADFLPQLTLPPHYQGPRGPLEGGLQNQRGPLGAALWVPRVRRDGDMEPVSEEGSPLPGQPHERGTGREKLSRLLPPPSSLSAMERNWVRLLSPPAGWGRGGGPALQFPPKTSKALFEERVKDGVLGAPLLHPAHPSCGSHSIRPIVLDPASQGYSSTQGNPKENPRRSLPHPTHCPDFGEGEGQGPLPRPFPLLWGPHHICH